MNKQTNKKNKMRKEQTTIVLITPNDAKRLLDNSKTKNRTVNKSNVLRYSNEMRQGKWKLNGESIKLDYDGNVIDGQHRLLAIINSNVSIETMVTTGLDPIVFGTLDTGKKRDGSDVLSIHDVKNSRLVASTIKMVKQLDKGIYGDRGSSGRVLSNEDFPHIYFNDPDGYQTSVKLGTNLYKAINSAITPTLISSFHYYLMKRYGYDVATDFMDKLCLGHGLTTNSPVLALRNKLISNKMDNKKEKLFQSDLIKYMIIGFNKYYENIPSKQLRLPENEILFTEPKYGVSTNDLQLF
jgi:hypothetical protein